MHLLLECGISKMRSLEEKSKTLTLIGDYNDAPTVYGKTFTEKSLSLTGKLLSGENEPLFLRERNRVDSEKTIRSSDRRSAGAQLPPADPQMVELQARLDALKK